MTAQAQNDWIRLRERGVELRVRLSPCSAREGAAGMHGDRIKIRLTAAPVDGLANQALVRFLAKKARMPANAIRIVAGQRSRSKTVLLVCDDPRALAARLRAVLDRPAS